MPRKNPEYRQSGVIHLLPLFLVLFAALIFVGYFLFKSGAVRTKQQAQTQVELAPDYKNPLDKSTQYVNPFSEYKNPFDLLAGD